MPIVSSSTPRRISTASGSSTFTSIPSAAGVEQDAGNPRTPSIFTRQVRQAPMGFMSGSLHSCGIYVPDMFTASSTDAPSSAATRLPLMESVIVMRSLS